MSNHSFPKVGSAKLRHGRRSEPGRIYLVTFTTALRVRRFDDWDAAVAAARVIALQSIWCDSRLLCWVLMPDHWHGLIELGITQTLPALIRRLKTRITQAMNAHHGTRGSIWAEGFHDHALRRDEDLLALARYIVLNPVRAGLARNVGAYPFWDAVWLDGEHRG